MAAWTQKEIEFVLAQKEKGLNRNEISEAFNEEFGTKRSANSIKHCYETYSGTDLTPEAHIDSIKATYSARKGRSKVTKENKAILDYVETMDSLKDQLDALFANVKFTKPKVIKKKKAKKSVSKMTTEHMITDLHYGKLSETFNYKVARERMQKLADVTIGEFDRYSKLYDIEKSIVYLGGDIIEGATIHGTESRVCSEAGNPDQIANAIYSLFEDYLIPICSYGHKIKVISVPGNHDRDGMYKTYNSPGKEAFTWVIYKALEHLCKVAGMKNVEFVITEGVYHIEDVYGSKVLYEHGDHIKGGTKASYEAHMAKRGVQSDTLIDFLRIGHYHERKEYGRGRIIMNPSLAGQDSYAEVNGYNTEAAQTINYYIKTNKARNPFYHSFCVYLDDEKLL